MQALKKGTNTLHTHSTYLQISTISMGYKSQCLANDFLLLRIKVLKQVVLATKNHQRYKQGIKQVLVLKGVALKHQNQKEFSLLDGHLQISSKQLVSTL